MGSPLPGVPRAQTLTKSPFPTSPMPPDRLAGENNEGRGHDRKTGPDYRRSRPIVRKQELDGEHGEQNASRRVKESCKTGMCVPHLAQCGTAHVPAILGRELRDKASQLA